MAVKQVTVFIGNKEGRIEKVTEVLKANGINISSLSLAESVDFGLLRLIVSDPEKAKDSLKAEGLSARLSDVIAVEISNAPGSLHELLTALKDYNIEYMYVLSASDKASMIMKIKDIEGAEATILAAGFGILTQSDVSK
ncbi:MAG: amino acid-binding protein [Lachnospiraceae bacterium]|nr:amino acid-binding protein [Lachnospiraceae bacterium]MBR2530969.1 amino acid-binding protein [Lachnospiraceae bacterium]